MPEHNFKKGDWVIWKDPVMLRRETDFLEEYGKGPFRVGDVRGNTLGIIHYFGFPHTCHHMRHITGLSADFFKPSDPPPDAQDHFDGCLELGEDI